MHSKMGLLWCEVLIKSALAFAPAWFVRGQGFPMRLYGLRACSASANSHENEAKRLLRKLAPLCVGITFINGTDALGAMPDDAPISSGGAAALSGVRPVSSTKADLLFGIGSVSPSQDASLFGIRPVSSSQDASLTLLCAEHCTLTQQSFTSATTPTPLPEIPKITHIPKDIVSNLQLPNEKELTCLCGNTLHLAAPSSRDMLASPWTIPRHSYSFDNAHKAELTTVDTAIAISKEATSPTQSIKLASVFHGRSSLKAAVQVLEPEQDSLAPISQEVSLQTQELGVSQEVSLQAQNPTVTPPITLPVTPENLQPNPNQDRFLQPPPSPAPVPPASEPSIQPSPTPAPVPPAANPPVQPPATPNPSPSSNTQTIPVKTIEVTGSTVFGSDQLNSIIQPFEGRDLTLEQLRQVADAITQLYLDRGYITSRAILVDQAITNGVVQIRVIEGSLEEIQIEGTRRVNPDYIRSRVQLGAGTPLSTAKLEDQLRLLRADPLFENVEASLRAGSRVGQSILIVRVVEGNPFEGSLGIDNYSPPSVGSERLGASALYRNLTGDGDTVAASYYHTTRSGADSFELSYRVPVNPMNGALQLRTSLSRNKVVESDFSFFNIQGDSQLYEISFQQPLVRSPRQEFALSLGLTVQESKALAGPFPISPGANSEGITNTSVIKFGQDYIRRDPRGAWSVRSLFSLGTGLFGATINPDPDPDGRFFSWLGQVQRVQVLNNDNFLIVGTDIQLTPDTLLPSQQFVIGGGQSLRGYRQNIRAGDNGVRFSIEDRITLQRDADGAPTFQVAPFFDAGVIWNDSDNPATLPSQRFLAGLGLGVIWQPLPKLNLRLDYALPLVDLEDRGYNVQDNGFYFSLRYQL